MSKEGKEIAGINIMGQIVGLMIAIWLISESYYAFAFFVLGMLPAILSFVIDKGADRFASKAIFSSNLTGILPFLFDIAISPEKTIAAKQIMYSPFTWFFVYGFASVGGMMIWVIPEVTSIFFSVKSDIKAKQLAGEQKELLQEWGAEVITGKARVSKEEREAQEAAQQEQEENNKQS